MGDRTFAAEGDPVHVGPVGPHVPDQAAPDRNGFGQPGRRVADDVDAHIGVLRRMQARLNRQLSVLSRMHGDPRHPEPPQLPELLELARRMRRDTESLLLMAGRAPGTRDERPRVLADVLSDAAAAAEEPRRVGVAAAPKASIVPGAATEFQHVLAELFDHAAAVYPEAHIAVVPRVDASGGVFVEVRADGSLRHDPDGLGGRRALDAAEQLARRSTAGIEVYRAPAGEGLVASVACPSSAVLIAEEPLSLAKPERDVPANGFAAPATNGRAGTNGHEPARDPAPRPRPGVAVAGISLDAPLEETDLPPVSPLAPLSALRPDPPVAEPAPDTSGPRALAPPAHTPDTPGPDTRASEAAEPDTFAPDPYASDPYASSPFAPDSFPADPFSADPFSADPADTATPSSPALPIPGPAGVTPPGPGLPDTGASAAVAPGLDTSNTIATPESGIPVVDDRSPADLESLPVFSAVGSARGPGKVDELFGPIADLPFDPDDSPGSTPIFEGLASAWFRDDGSSPEGDEAPLDWESPSDREWREATERVSRVDESPLTTNGLPRRRPGNQLVPPPRTASSPVEKPAERVPDRIRDRLSGYQRGLRQGRHRAESGQTHTDPGDPEFW